MQCAAKHQDKKKKIFFLFFGGAVYVYSQPAFVGVLWPFYSVFLLLLSKNRMAPRVFIAFFFPKAIWFPTERRARAGVLWAEGKERIRRDRGHQSGVRLYEQPAFVGVLRNGVSLKIIIKLYIYI